MGGADPAGLANELIKPPGPWRTVATAARGGHRSEIRDRLWAFYSWCADAQIPELTTLAETIETWWPAIGVFLTTGLTNAATKAPTG
jgi:transposase